MDTKYLQHFQTIFWDFDGVILNSNSVRDIGFEKVLEDFPKNEVSALLDFHKTNGGLSRYVKFRYFFEKIRKESVTEEIILEYAERFSVIMKSLLTDKNLLISETVSFISNNHHKVPMIVVSGSDQNELRYLCEALNIKSYFKRIHGSPKPKVDWINQILQEEALNPSECILVGDSLNDYEAAHENNMPFMAYNNPAIEQFTSRSIDFNKIL